MGIAQLQFRKGNFIGKIELDVIIQEGASASVRITRNPVEKGADMNDHVIVDPMIFSMQGVVSNSTISPIEAIGTAISSLSNAKSKAEFAWDALLDLMISKTIITLVQGLRSYNNVLLETLQENQDKDTSNGLFFSATFSALNIVGLAIVTEDQFDDPDISDGMIPASEGGLKQLGAS